MTLMWSLFDICIGSVARFFTFPTTRSAPAARDKKVLTRVRMTGSTSLDRDPCSVAQNQPGLNRKRGATTHARIANPELLFRAAGQRRRGRVDGVLIRAAAALRVGVNFDPVLVGTR